MYVFNNRGAFWGVLLASALAVSLTVVGCARRNAPSDPALARQSLKAALEIWQAGDAPAKLRQREPPITMVDPAWKDGRKLESFEIIGPEVDDGVNLICPVKLVCKDEKGNTLQTQIKYIIGTSPIVTIFRHRSNH